MKLKKIYQPHEVLDGGYNYNINYNNPNYKAFICSAKELYVILELETKKDLYSNKETNGYSGLIINSNFYSFEKIYFAVDMCKDENRKKSAWFEVF